MPQIPNSQLKYFVIVGTGGSTLGIKTIYHALLGHLDTLQPNRFPKILFLENAEPEELQATTELLGLLNPNEFFVNVIGKSGKTLEVTTIFENLLENLPQIKTRLAITTEENSPLHKLAQELDAKFLPVSPDVSDRFSALLPERMFPLEQIGIDVEKLLEGANKPNESAAQESAQRLFSNLKNGKTIHNLFVFEPCLAAFGKWYEQLLAESLSKDGKGITPTTSVGTVDLHSKTQLDLGGPQNKMFTFLRAEWAGENSLTAGVKKALYLAAKKSYENKVEVAEIVLPEISEFELARLMQTKMLEVKLLAELMGVNAFDQPNVEEYKRLALELL